MPSPPVAEMVEAARRLPVGSRSAPLAPVARAVGGLLLAGLAACGDPCAELQDICEVCNDPNQRAACERSVDEDPAEVCEQNLDSYQRICP